MNLRALVPAAIISPLMMPVTFAVGALFKGIALGEIYSGVALFYAPVSYLIGALLGIPMFLLLRRLGLTNVVAYVFGGALIGLLTAYLIQELLAGRGLAGSHFVIWMVGSAISALVFWLFMFGLRYERQPL